MYDGNERRSSRTGCRRLLSLARGACGTTDMSWPICGMRCVVMLLTYAVLMCKLPRRHIRASNLGTCQGLHRRAMTAAIAPKPPLALLPPPVCQQLEGEWTGDVVGDVGHT